MTMPTVKALDLFNLAVGSEVTTTIQSSRTDYKHMPCVLDMNEHQQKTHYVMQEFGLYAKGERATAVMSREDHGATDLIVMATGQANAEIMRGKCPTLNSEHEQPILVSNQETLQRENKEGVRMSLQLDGEEKESSAKSNVRRLTPGECEVLQGFPRNWTLIGTPEEVDVKDYDITYDENGDVVSKTEIGSHKEIEYYYLDSDGKKRRCADAGRYRALGNSICTPFWFWLCRRISAQYERPATMGSLFSGIGGFEYCWVRCNGTKTVLWASEIEEFPIAVTRQHFGDEDMGIEGDIQKYL